ncbi:hypothetical protein NV379_05485 [Paenibacillus sp. N1-5-1-14]|uniref:hypothetical protein n=1 Tax=Paenibacillus radicibacter TaxID=2972488 RepID=UPI0021594374|nr:hypothetical protein [Paenibacillus radicibacter]MCR8642105.1 hypothetical protein [Paenibacillus radicibacter]
MRQILFVGACEKSDLLLYSSALLAAAGKKVLLIDATTEQKLKYSVPRIDGDGDMTEYEGFYVSYGLKTGAEVRTYLEHVRFDGLLLAEAGFDTILIDTNHREFFEGISIQDYTERVYVTNYEKSCIHVNEEILQSVLPKQSGYTPFIPIIKDTVDCQINTEYFEKMLGHHPIAWSGEFYEIEFDELDYASRIDNQNHNRLRLNRLSKAYQRTLIDVTTEISGMTYAEMKSAFKRIKKGRH